MKQVPDKRTFSQLIPTLFRRAAWAPLAVFLLHIGIILFSHSFSQSPLSSVLLHMMGGVAIAFFFWRTLEIMGVRVESTQLPDRFLTGLFAVTLTATAAVIWEFAEFIGDRIMGTTMQAGLGDTMLDMFLGIVCGAITVFIACHIARSLGGERSKNPGLLPILIRFLNKSD